MRRKNKNCQNIAYDNLKIHRKIHLGYLSKYSLVRNAHIDHTIVQIS